MRLVEPRRRNVLYDVYHVGSRFWIVTNDGGALNFKLMHTSPDTPSSENWKAIVPYDVGTKIDCLKVFASHVVMFGRKGGLTHVEIYPLLESSCSTTLPTAPTSSNDCGGKASSDDGGGSGGANGSCARCEFVGRARTLDWPEPAYVVKPERNAEFAARYVRVAYSSLVTPPAVYDVHFDGRTRTLVQEQAVPLYDRALYETRRIHVGARDGTQIPLSIVYRRHAAAVNADADADVGVEGKPCVLTAYGAYGLCLEPEFDAARLPWLDRGVVWVIAHVRGGGELGRQWYEAGKLLHKKNTFTDLLDCAAELVSPRRSGSGAQDAEWRPSARGIADPRRLALVGGSAGGLLVGAALNARPDLFRVAWTRVPFVDVLVTMSDPSIPLVAVEWDEWGNPAADAVHRAYIRSYSPVDNVAPARYPALLVTTALDDARVPYWEPSKWVARLRAAALPGSGPLLLATKMAAAAGHAGVSGRYAHLRVKAAEVAFVLDQLGVGH